MENQHEDQQNAANQVYQFAANLMVNEKLDAAETQKVLVEKGLNEESASIVVTRLAQQIKDARKERANKDVLYGALWCVGGIVATAADIGFIFWGAIVFGGYQFLKGLTNLRS